MEGWKLTVEYAGVGVDDGEESRSEDDPDEEPDDEPEHAVSSASSTNSGAWDLPMDRPPVRLFDYRQR
jgi:hypothetical protein